MFDVGFWEIALIGVIALLVIGPERLPGVARTVGQWVGKARSFMSYVQADFKAEINKTEELKRLLIEQSKIKDVHEIIEQTVTDTRGGVSVGAPLAKHEVKSFGSNDDDNNKEPNKEPNKDNSVTKVDTKVDHNTIHGPSQRNASGDHVNSDIANSDIANIAKAQPDTKVGNDQAK
jgi:sec-independent protein translocase protein TatB